MQYSTGDSPKKQKFQIPIIDQYQKATEHGRSQNTKQLFIALISSFAVMGFLMLNIQSLLTRQELRKYATVEKAELSIQPATITGIKESPLYLGIIVTPQKKITGITVNLTYNAQDLTIQNIEPGSFFTKHEEFVRSLKSVTADTTHGKEISISFSPESKFSNGTSDIAVNLRIIPRTSGTFTLGIDKEKSQVIDESGNDILATVSGSILTIY